jgi:stringent starvation protein B
MLPRDSHTLARLQELVASLIERRVAASLVEVESALVRWRQGSLSALGAHGAVLRHAARCERAVERVTAAATDRPEGILRDAVDVGLMTETEFVAMVGVASDTVAATQSLTEDEAAPVADKRKTVESLLEQGPVLIHIDPRRDGVAVPTRFAQDPGLRLRFGYGLSPAITDLVVDEHGVSGTLSFGGVAFHCVLPWSAIYAVQIDGDSKGSVWPDDVPDVVLAQAAEHIETPEAVESKESTEVTELPKKKGGHLKLVE